MTKKSTEHSRLIKLLILTKELIPARINRQKKMKIETHNINDTKIAEVISEVNIINKIEDVFKFGQ